MKGVRFISLENLDNKRESINGVPSFLISQYLNENREVNYF